MPNQTRTALVTGGARGLGAAVADRLRQDDINVITLDVRPGADLIVDITDAAGLERAVSELPEIDILINSAGVVGPGLPLWKIPPPEWERVMRVNVTGTYNACRLVVPAMVSHGWGRIVNFASMAGKDGNPGLSAYSASKGAVIAMTKSLGKELATTGVIVNAIAPAVIDTPMNADTEPAVLDHITSLIPMRRIGRPDEVAELVAWLSSERVSFSTGAVYDISGGRATY